MTFTPYLHFNGTCAEAMAAYAAIFSTDAPEILTFGDAPPGMFEDAASDRVMHSSINLGGSVLMASDYPPGNPEDAPPQASVSISHMLESAEAAQAVFDRLLEGGEVIMPFGETFFSSGFGMVKDRFGTHWMIMTMDPEGD